MESLRRMLWRRNNLKLLAVFLVYLAVAAAFALAYRLVWGRHPEWYLVNPAILEAQRRLYVEQQWASYEIGRRSAEEGVHAFARLCSELRDRKALVERVQAGLERDQPRLLSQAPREALGLLPWGKKVVATELGEGEERVVFAVRRAELRPARSTPPVQRVVLVGRQGGREIEEVVARNVTALPVVGRDYLPWLRSTASALGYQLEVYGRELEKQQEALKGKLRDAEKIARLEREIEDLGARESERLQEESLEIFREPIWTFADFYYFSLLTLSGASFGEIQPLSPVVRWLVMVEVLMGLVLLIVFINFTVAPPHRRLPRAEG